MKLGVSKKTEKPIKPRKPEKNNRINRTVKINRLKFKKNRPVWFDFGFISLKPKKPNRTELNSNRKKLEKIEPKPSQTEKTDPNRFESVVVQKKPNRTKISRFEPVLVQFRFFFKKNFGLVIFFYKNRTNRK